MKVLVTGGAGYIGTTLVPMLLEQGHEVTVLDNFMYNQSPLLECCAYDGFEIVRGDTRDYGKLDPLVEKADVIIPLACLTGAPLCAADPVGAQTIVVDAVKRIIEKTSDNQMILYPTTNSGYGIGEEGKHCTEDTPLRPISIYGKVKVEAENLLLDTKRAITFRLATAFGVSPRMRLDLLVNDFTYRAVHDRFIVLFEAHFNRNFCHVKDISRVFLHGMDKFDSMKGESYNVGLSDTNINKRQLCEAIKKYVPEFYFVESEIGEDPDKRDYIVSNEKIEATGFKPEVSLDQGIKELVKAYKIIKRNQYANI